MIQRIVRRLYPILDYLFRRIDRTHIRRTRNIRLIPEIKNRRGGKVGYAEWAHVIGIFQTVFYQTLDKKTDNHILDIGCGTGLLGIAAEPFTYGSGSYTGIDVMKHDINYCSEHYTADNYHFVHFDVANAMYADDQNKNLIPWPTESSSMDLVTGLSVWTHLREEDALFYFKEIARVLKDKGKAVITFFYLDNKYEESLPKRSEAPGRFHSTKQHFWVFDKQAYDSKNWFCPKWVSTPEDAIGVNEEALKMLCEESGLKLKEYHPGNWKEIPGVYFQDILVFEK